MILVMTVIGIFSAMPVAAYAENPAWEGVFRQYGKGGQTVAGAVKKTASGSEITLETLKTYIGMKQREISYDLVPVNNGAYYDTVKKISECTGMRENCHLYLKRMQSLKHVGKVGRSNVMMLMRLRGIIEKQ